MTEPSVAAAGTESQAQAPNVPVIIPETYNVQNAVRITPNLAPYDVFPQDGSGPLAGQAFNNQVIRFEIPPKQAINLANSSIQMDITTSIATGNANNLGSLLARPDVVPFSQLRFYTRKGTHLVNLPDFREYINVVAIPSISHEKAQQRTPFSGHSTRARADALAGTFGAAAQNAYIVPPATNTNPRGLMLTGEKYLRDAGAAVQKHVSRFHYSSAIQACQVSAYEVKGATPPMYMRYELRLGDLVGTLFSWDKTMMFPTTTLLEVVVGDTLNMVSRLQGSTITQFDTELHSIPSDTLQAPLITGALGNANLAATAITFTNVRLRLMQDLNPIAINAWLQRLMSGGFVMNLPWTRLNVVNLGAAAQAQSHFRIGAAEGQTLLRIQSAVRRTTTPNPADCLQNYMYNNIAGAEVKQYRTSVRNKPLQIRDINVEQGHDWEHNRHHLRDSLAGGTHENHLSYIWIHIDKFGGGNLPITKCDVTDFHKSGVPINSPDAEFLYRIEYQAKRAEDMDSVSAIVAQKQLLLLPSEIAVR